MTENEQCRWLTVGWGRLQCALVRRTSSRPPILSRSTCAPTNLPANQPARQRLSTAGYLKDVVWDLPTPPHRQAEENALYALHSHKRGMIYSPFPAPDVGSYIKWPINQVSDYLLPRYEGGWKLIGPKDSFLALCDEIAKYHQPVQAAIHPRVHAAFRKGAGITGPKHRQLK
ncbi:hypothetical protein BV22DRAFT_1048846 [Leucogyrophana mollusca]|uniref:Uncharacterized protein n=1 Tax=Leucogyrophana mollusca TaxID=85980 RepID=A0ACB8BB46_9AGAM|nr:hypothetical protein BV22DRAFT_1048846 [Leucogyrophana mollusca]